MRNWQKALISIVLAAISMALTACASRSADVPSLGVTPTAVVVQEPLDDEHKVMAFVQCMRDQGIEYEDPIIDSEGNVQSPKLVEGFTVTREELAGPYAECAHHLEGLSFGRDRQEAAGE